MTEKDPLADIRKRIDEIDKSIQDLVSERASCAARLRKWVLIACCASSMTAITAGFIPTQPQMVYGVYGAKQQVRAEATNASDYYTMGGTLIGWNEGQSRKMATPLWLNAE